jgi:hypothetical protein
LLTSYDSDGFPARVSLIQNLATVSDLIGPTTGLRCHALARC